MNTVYVEAETFQNLGGWIIDTQCVESMGSPYLMAHGMGVPVNDASTKIWLPQSGKWHFYVRTRDWTAVWKRGHSAGRFQLGVNGIRWETALGTNGSAWAWQKVGEKELPRGEITLSLHDLTGFNGRCDAVFLTLHPAVVPPDDTASLRDYKQIHFPSKVYEDPAFYDLLICGGGYAGTCAAATARMTGQKFLLIQDRAMLGGCNSSEIRVWMGGLTQVGKYPKLGAISAALGPVTGFPYGRKCAEIFEDDRKRLLFLEGENLLLQERLESVETDPFDPRKIVAVVTNSIRTGIRTRRRAACFADCTGDAFLARLCGCETIYGREAASTFGEALAPEKADRQVMGHSTLWSTRERDCEVPFPNIDWGIEFNDESALRRERSDWDWECGQYRNQVRDIEQIRDYGLMSAFCNWSFLKNHAADREKRRKVELEWISPIGGKREGYRVWGDYLLTQNDIDKRLEHPDATASISWSYDLHFPDPENEAKFGEAFLSCAYHRGIGDFYEVPYRCLYARDMDNLFLGGRIISVSHIAFSCVRVMRTLGMLGEVIGMASALCRKHACHPRAVYTEHLEELCENMKQGLKLPETHGYQPDRSESFHFMRPIGSVGNAGENVWVRLRPEKTEPIPESLKHCLEKLNVNLLPGSKI